LGTGRQRAPSRAETGEKRAANLVRVLAVVVVALVLVVLLRELALGDVRHGGRRQAAAVGGV